jgi:hypothetical protein
MAGVQARQPDRDRRQRIVQQIADTFGVPRTTLCGHWTGTPSAAAGVFTTELGNGQ